MLDHQIITVFILSCVGIMALVLGFAIRVWVTHLDKTISDLNKTIVAMTKLIADLEKDVALQRQKTAQNTKDIRKIEIKACGREDCPFKGVPLHLHHRRFDELMQMADLVEPDESGANDVVD